ncbi:universal stress protein [Streptomyces sp. NPDC087512]|uniref:universal stress protein n=1 Tax=unclassified Streptomyces TaxID=2593676 RepID=UPI0034141EDE
MTRPAVVGVDGSPSGRNAVGTAAHEAAPRGAELRPAHAFGGPVPHVTPGGPAPAPRRDGRLREAPSRRRNGRRTGWLRGSCAARSPRTSR